MADVLQVLSCGNSMKVVIRRWRLCGFVHFNCREKLLIQVCFQTYSISAACSQGIRDQTWELSSAHRAVVCLKYVTTLEVQQLNHRRTAEKNQTQYSGPQNGCCSSWHPSRTPLLTPSVRLLRPSAAPSEWSRQRHPLCRREPTHLGFYLILLTDNQTIQARFSSRFSMGPFYLE